MRLGIIDWGIGGCGLYALLKSRWPDHGFIYLSDAGFEPYGKVNPSELSARIQQCIQFLRNEGATHIAVACNAAGTVVEESDSTTSIVRHARELIESSSSRKIGIIGGHRIIASKQYALKSNLHQVVAQPLSALIESGDVEGENIDTCLKSIVSKLPEDIDELVLACTHYPAVANEIKRFLPSNCTISDPAERMCDWICSNWQKNDYFQGNDLWFTTGTTKNTVNGAKTAFGVTIDSIKQIKI